MFQTTLCASAEITERAAQLWGRIQSYVSEKGLTAQLLVRFEILTLCIAGVTLEYDRREREFASYLEVLRYSRRSRVSTGCVVRIPALGFGTLIYYTYMGMDPSLLNNERANIIYSRFVGY